MMPFHTTADPVRRMQHIADREERVKPDCDFDGMPIWFARYIRVFEELKYEFAEVVQLPIESLTAAKPPRGK